MWRTVTMGHQTSMHPLNTKDNSGLVSSYKPYLVMFQPESSWQATYMGAHAYLSKVAIF